MNKPVIGISCNYDHDDIFKDGGDMSLMYHYVSHNYVRAVMEAGGIPLLLPIYDKKEDLDQVLESLDGVVLSGGNDIDPLIFGETDRGKCGRIIPERDDQDLYIARRAAELKKPLLCICRGIQVLNVALGGSLYQDLPSDGDFFSHSKSNYPLNRVSHHVKVEKDSLLYDITGIEDMGVNSFHHQAVKDVAPGLRATAVSPDGVIEALETEDSVSEGSCFLLGLQWHPEKMYDDPVQKKIFDRFIEASGT